MLSKKIAQIAPLYERVPPKLYGGTERIVSYLTEELAAQGHEVTLFASGDSATSASLVPCCDVALRLNPAVRDPLPYHVMMLEQVREAADDFDVLHWLPPDGGVENEEGVCSLTTIAWHSRTPNQDHSCAPSAMLPSRR